MVLTPLLQTRNYTFAVIGMHAFGLILPETSSYIISFPDLAQSVGKTGPSYMHIMRRRKVGDFI
jgi:hypothetical protein